MKKIAYLDIDGTAHKADIQGYVGQIKLFSDDIIKDFEYIKKSINFMLNKARNDGSSDEVIDFIERVYKYVSYDMFEMLKEQRDCFLEFDNYFSKEDKQKYLESYISNMVLNPNNAEIPNYMNYIIASLTYSLRLIQIEHERVKREGGVVNLPFETINQDNDIISYDSNEDPLKRALSALNLMKDYAKNYAEGRDAFIDVCLEYMDKSVVDYDEIYTSKNLMPGVVSSLEYLLSSGEVDLIVACSHYTGERESMAKKRLFSSELPFVMMLSESLLKFHTEPARMGLRRERSSKDKRINEMNLKISEILDCTVEDIVSILFEDSVPNLEGLNDKIGILFLNGKQNNSASAQKFIKQNDWNIDDLIEIFSNINKQLTSMVSYQKVKC